MAVVLRLANKAQSTTYDFLTGYLRPQNRTTSPNGDGWVTESMTLVARTADANILSAVETIDELANTSDLFWSDNHEIASVWFEESATAEVTKRALVQSIQIVPVTVNNLSPTLGKTGAMYMINIVRSAIWENITQANATYTGLTSLLGGSGELAAIDGSYPARIEKITIQGVSIVAGDITTVWCGIKPLRGGDTDFNQIIGLQLGTLAGGAALATDTDGTPTTDANNVVLYTTTTDEVEIETITIDQATASTNFHHWVGDYLVLLRAKVSAAQTVRLSLEWGYAGGAIFKLNPDVYISSTSYQFYEMGSVSVPPFPRLASSASVDNFQFKISVIRLGTATNLSIDCLALIPREHYFKVTGATISIDGGLSCQCYNLEDGSIYCFNTDVGGNPNLAVQYAPKDFVYPIEGGKMCWVIQKAAVSEPADSADVVLYWNERFRTHAE